MPSAKDNKETQRTTYAQYWECHRFADSRGGEGFVQEKAQLPFGEFYLENHGSLLSHVVLDKMPWIEVILMLETLEVVDLVAERL